MHKKCFAHYNVRKVCQILKQRFCVCCKRRFQFENCNLLHLSWRRGGHQLSRMQIVDSTKGIAEVMASLMSIKKMEVDDRIDDDCGDTSFYFLQTTKENDFMFD